MSESDPQALYWAPVYRAGIVCELIDQITSERAKIIREKLLARWKIIANEIETSPSLSGWRAATPTGGTPESETHEGPAALYPPVKVQFGIFDGEARASVTVCRPPRHPKVWMRLSYLSGGVGAEHFGAFNPHDLGLFFTQVDRIVRGQAMDVFVRNYQEILNSELGSDEKLREAHFIRILTATADLGSVAEKLEARDFRLKQSIADPDEYERLRGLLYLTYGKEMDSAAERERLPAGYGWMSVRSRGEGEDLIGLYSTHFGSTESTYVGVVHSSVSDPKKALQTTRHFSERLLNDIAPQI
jgi:hypothetical protein